MSDKDLFKEIVEEYFHNTFERYEFDLMNVKNDIILHGCNADRLLCLKVVETRLDTISFEFRKIKQLIDIYLSDNK